MTPSRQRALVFALIGIGLLIVGFFGMRTLRSFRDFRGHRPPPFAPAANDQKVETDVELIRDWMTIGYISHTYHTRPRLLYDALGIPARDNEKKSLRELNDEYFPDQPDHVLTVVKAALQASLPPPTAIPADTAVASPPAAP
jgi:predicted short-subunit dehydrogenase-like oxidoreductase (DUF2520 family)